MISVKQNAILRKKIKNYANIKDTIHKVLFHPITLVLFVAVPLYSTFFDPGGIYSDISIISRAMFNTGWTIFYFLMSYLFLPYFLRIGLSRNIPFIWMLTLLFTLLACFEAKIMTFIVLHGGWIDYLKNLASTMTVILAAILIMPSFFKSFIENNLSNDPKYMPFWIPVRLDVPNGDTILDSKIMGIVTHLKVQQNYTHIFTTEGDYLERGSLSDVLKLIDADSGVRIHRSMWVRKDRIEALIYKNGNPKVKTVDGELFSASRDSIFDIKKVLDTKLTLN